MSRLIEADASKGGESANFVRKCSLHAHADHLVGNKIKMKKHSGRAINREWKKSIPYIRQGFWFSSAYNMYENSHAVY